MTHVPWIVLIKEFLLKSWFSFNKFLPNLDIVIIYNALYFTINFRSHNALYFRTNGVDRN